MADDDVRISDNGALPGFPSNAHNVHVLHSQGGMHSGSSEWRVLIVLSLDCYYFRAWYSIVWRCDGPTHQPAIWFRPGHPSTKY